MILGKPSAVNLFKPWNPQDGPHSNICCVRAYIHVQWVVFSSSPKSNTHSIDQLNWRLRNRSTKNGQSFCLNCLAFEELTVDYLQFAPNSWRSIKLSNRRPLLHKPRDLQMLHSPFWRVLFLYEGQLCHVRHFDSLCVKLFQLRKRYALHGFQSTWLQFATYGEFPIERSDSSPNAPFWLICLLSTSIYGENSI